MSRTKEMARNTMILGMGIFVSRILNMITTPFISGYTSDADFGLIDLVTTTILSFVIPVCALQIEQGIYRFMIDSKENQKQFSNIISSGSFMLLIVTLIISIVTYFIPVTGFEGNFKYLLILYIIIEVIIHTLRAIARGLQMTKVYSFSSIISVLVNFTVLFIGVVYLKWGYIAVIVALTAADVVASIYIIWKTKIWNYLNRSKINIKMSKEILDYSLPFVPNAVAWYINMFSDRILIGMYLGLAANGVYGMAMKIPSIINLLYPAFNLSWIESSIKASNDGNKKDYYNKIFKQSYALITAGTALLIAGSPILFVIFNRNPELNSAIYSVGILIVASYFYCFSQFFSSFYIVAKDTKKMTGSTLVAAIINIVINLLFLEQYGVIIAAVSTLVSNFSLAAYRYVNVNKNYTKLKLSKRVMAVTMFTFIVLCILSLSSSWIVCIINILLATLFAYILCGDIVIGFIKSKILK